MRHLQYKSAAEVKKKGLWRNLISVNYELGALLEAPCIEDQRIIFLFSISHLQMPFFLFNLTCVPSALKIRPKWSKRRLEPKWATNSSCLASYTAGQDVPEKRARPVSAAFVLLQWKHLYALISHEQGLNVGTP